MYDFISATGITYGVMLKSVLNNCWIVQLNWQYYDFHSNQLAVYTSCVYDGLAQVIVTTKVAGERGLTWDRLSNQ